MTLQEAMEVFGDEPAPTDASFIRIGGEEAIIRECCGPALLCVSEKHGSTRLSCQDCGRTIGQVGRQWMILDWGSKGIVFQFGSPKGSVR